MSDHVANEVIDLHRFFQAWFTGSVEKTRKEYARFADTMADGMFMIPPGGNVMKRDDALEIFWQLHGANDPTFKIEVKNIEIREVTDSLYLVTYEEWQQTPEETARVVTALLQDKPTGLQWLSAHESWLPQD